MNYGLLSDTALAIHSTKATAWCAGSRGKTTTAWLLRGILEEAGLLTGLTGSIEHSISNDRLTDEGDLWTPEETDPSTEL